MPEEWNVRYNDIAFTTKLSPFKHTGIFPEQSLQWDWMKKHITSANRSVSVLNLFAYTGGASLIAAKAGASVTHVDASKPSISWANENQKASKLPEKSIRWILEDVMSFVRREVKRGHTYDGIIMDPPVFGHGPEGERWEFNENFPELLQLCKSLLSKDALFIIINAYAISSSALMLENSLFDIVEDLRGEIEVGELALEEKTNHRLLSTGIFARWSAKNI
jgi:23S rRNA (cytosine1962-C5)-methyltransferase